MHDQEENENIFIEDVTVEELLSSVMKTNSLLSGRLNRNRRLISINNDTESNQRLFTEEKSSDERPRLLGSRLAMQKTETQNYKLDSLTTPKMIRSVSTPEITRTKQFINKNIFSSNTLENNNRLELENGIIGSIRKPCKQETLLASLSKTYSHAKRVSNVNDRPIQKNNDFKGKSNSLVNIHKCYNSGAGIFNSNFQSRHFKISDGDTNNSLGPSLKGLFNIEKTSHSIQSTRSIDEILKEITINKKSKHIENTPNYSNAEEPRTKNALSFNAHVSASPKHSLQFNSNDIIIVNGKSYLKIKKLGKGGSSIVYEGLDLLTHHLRAIKIVDLKDEDESVKQSYKNEIKILQKLQAHSRIIKIFEHEETDTQFKLVMEAGGNDLAAILGEARQKKIIIPSYSVQHYFRDMVLAVQQIHSEGIIHSDLKPANFLLVDGILKLIDFGIASSIQNDMTSVFKDNQSGTFNYMSPESLSDINSGPIINGRVKDKPTIKIGVKSDIWSLGCILYNLAYGYTPFQHISNPLQKLAAISNANTRISFASLGDKKLLNVLQSTLLFNPRERPSIDDLIKHPYLNDDLKQIH